MTYFTPELEAFLKEKGAFEKAVSNCIKFPLVKDHFFSTLVWAFNWGSTSEGVHFWANLHDEFHNQIKT